MYNPNDPKLYKPKNTSRRTIAIRERTFRVVNATLSIHTGQAVGILSQRYAPDSPDGSSPMADYQAVFANLGSELNQARQAMLSADTTHLGLLAAIVNLQKQRDERSAELFDRYFMARHGLESFYGKNQSFELLAVMGDTPRDPTGLINQVRQTVEFLTQPKVVLPAVDLDRVQLDLLSMAAQLATEADQLEDVLDRIDREHKNAEVTRKAKNDAIESFDRIYLWVGRALESYFHLAGMHDLAERVRPSARRPGRRAADEHDTDKDQGSEDTSSTETSAAS